MLEHRKQWRNLVSSFTTISALAISVAGCGLGSDTGPGETIAKTAVLTGSQEITSVDTQAVGYASITVNSATREIAGSVVYTGMTATAAHMHIGAAGKGSLEPVVSFTVSNETQRAIIPDGTIISQSAYDALLAGNVYVNVHSAQHSQGEIRGQFGRLIMTTNLTGSQNVPPENTSAAGFGLITVDPILRKMDGYVTYSGLVPTYGHVHIGAPGTNGTQIVALAVDNKNNRATLASDITLTPDQYKGLLGGQFYFNIHSELFPEGELRGQIGPVVVTAKLDGDQEVPPVTTTATGTAVLVVDPITYDISGGVNYNGMAATRSEIHAGVAGKNGNPFVTLKLEYNTAHVQPGTRLTQTQFESLVKGEIYINVHSQTHQNGEIRGQLHLPQ